MRSTLYRFNDFFLNSKECVNFNTVKLGKFHEFEKIKIYLSLKILKS